MKAFQGYEAFVAALHGQEYDVDVDPTGDVIQIESGGFTEEDALPPVQPSALQTVAMDLRRAVLAHQPTGSELDEIERRYRQHVIRWFENLTFQGMMRSPRPIVLPLEDVYVELRAVAEVPEAADTFSVDERRLLMELEAEDPEQLAPERRRELMSQLDAFRRERWSQTLPERKSIAEALHRPDQRAFVILGD